MTQLCLLSVQQIFFKLSLSIILILYKVVADIHENYFKLAMYKQASKQISTVRTSSQWFVCCFIFCLASSLIAYFWFCRCFYGLVTLEKKQGGNLLVTEENQQLSSDCIQFFLEVVVASNLPTVLFQMLLTQSVSYHF